MSKFVVDGGSVSGNLNIDNVIVDVGTTTTSEPASMILFSTGLVGVLGASSVVSLRIGAPQYV